jgi:dihydroorotate dehydrogenase
MLSLLRIFPPEVAHFIALKSLNILYWLGILKFIYRPVLGASTVTIGSLTFPNRLGIAAGLDKNGDYFNALGSLGFGFIEVGTITPRPQYGNPKPRIWRIPSNNSIINSLGFNNKGVEYLVRNLKKRKFKGVLGINIGANKDSDKQQRIEDYIFCFREVARYADYITINISSPNTPGLRDFHQEEDFKILITKIASIRDELKFSKPIFVKLSPDEDQQTISKLVDIARASKFDGFIATNTTISRDMISSEKFRTLPGGLSGELIKNKSNKVIEKLAALDSGSIIGVGGVASKEDFDEKINLGASLVQVYTGFIYKGPKIISEIFG